MCEYMLNAHAHSISMEMSRGDSGRLCKHNNHSAATIEAVVHAMDAPTIANHALVL